MPDIVSILGLGAIGLGFLLAYLTYRLLATERTNNKPIYVYQFFCFALVLVGAGLQYSSTIGNQSVDELQSKIKSLQAELTPLKSRLPKMQKDLQAATLSLNKSENRNEQLTGKLSSAVAAMQSIVSTIPKSIEDLEKVNAVLTGNSCSGGSAGVPLWNGRGTQMAALSTTVIRKLAAAKSSIEGVLP